MAGKKSKARKEDKPVTNPHAARMRVFQIVFLVLSIMIILAMILTSFATTF